MKLMFTQLIYFSSAVVICSLLITPYAFYSTSSYFHAILHYRRGALYGTKTII